MSGLRLVDDTPYNATTWENVGGIAPSKGAVRNAIEARAGLVTVADNTADTTCWIPFVGTQTGSLLSVLSNSGLTFNASTATMGVTGLTVTNDVTINGHKVGRGLNNDSGMLAVGFNTFSATTSANTGTATGVNAGRYLTSAAGFVGVGYEAGENVTDGNTLTIIGRSAARTVVSGGGNATSMANGVYVGANCKPYSNASVDEIVIGADAQGVATSGIVIGSSANSVFRGWGTPTFGGANSLTFSLASLTAARTKTLQDTTSTLAEYGDNLSVFAATTSAQLAGVISDETGSGALVFGTAPTISGGSITGLTGLAIRDTSAAFDVTLAATSSTALTAGRTLTLNVVDAARTLRIQGNPTIDDWFDQAVKAASVPTFAGVKTAYNYPAADSTTAWSVRKADASTHVITVDTTNSRVGIGGTPTDKLDVVGNIVFGARGTGSASLFTIKDTVANYTQPLLYPASGTNVSTVLYVVPRGTGAGTTLRGQIGAFGTDYNADSTNYELVALRSGATICDVMTYKGGTGTGRDLRISANNATTASNQLYLTAGGGVAVNTSTTTLGRFTVLDASAAQIVAANTVNEWLGITVGATGTATYAITTTGTARHVFSNRINIPTATPASAAATGTTGDIVWDASYIYVCTATNTWKRVAIATW